MDREKTLYLVRKVAREFCRQYFCFKEYTKLYDNKNPQGRLPIMIENNFFDVALLNWAHLFGNWNDSLHFKNILDDCENFKNRIKEKLSLCDRQWDDHWNLLKDFRDKRVGHFDLTIETIVVPQLDIAYKCIAEYYIEVTTELENI